MSEPGSRPPRASTVAAQALGAYRPRDRRDHSAPSVEGPGSACPPDLLRLLVRLEDPEDLLADLEQALTASRNTSL